MKLLKMIVLTLVALGVMVYLGLLIGVWGMQDRLMFGRRTNTLTERPADRGWGYEDVWIETPEGKTHGWWIPLEDARGTILFSHGSGRNVSGYLDDAALFREQGFSVLVYDYGGYGLSTGKPSEKRCCTDALAMWNHLVQDRHIAPERIVIAGASMGGGVTSELATHVSPCAVILESTFTSVPDTLWDTYPAFPYRLICHIRYENIKKVGLIKCPVLVIHSKDDTVVPFSHSQKLFAEVTAAKLFQEIRGGHYAGKFSTKDLYSSAVARFLKDYARL